MRLFEYPEAKSVVVSGDIHGDFHTLVYKLCAQYRMTDILLIVAGDCGFGFDKPAYFNEERIAYRRWRTMNQIYECLHQKDFPIKTWLYGHFHASWSSVIDSIRFKMLDIMEFCEIPDKTECSDRNLDS